MSRPGALRWAIGAYMTPSQLHPGERRDVKPPPDAGSPAPALLVRLDRNPLHHGTLGAVRSLGRAGIEVHALVESASSPVTRSRHLHAAHTVPPAT